MNNKQIIKKYNALTDENAHGEAVMLLVKKFGTQDEIKELEAILKVHKKRGSILYEEAMRRTEISQKYYNQLFN